MAISKLESTVLAHLEWIGFVRPTGLVVSAPALVRADAILNRSDAEGQKLLQSCTAEFTFDAKTGPVPYLPDFRVFATSVLGWSFTPKFYVGTPESPIPAELEVTVAEETLRPDFAVREPEPKEGASAWQLLVQVVPLNADLDRPFRGKGALEASHHSRLERLLRQTGVTAGLLFNGRTVRLVSAPRGESSGWLDFHVADMVQTAGRPISTALRLLLSQNRLLSLPKPKRLMALLEDSRKFQNEVSERLAEQVLHALYELLRGFQAAHDASKGELLNQQLREHPNEVYRGLLNVILRLVFLLYAEERDMLPEDETFLRYYSLAGLYERLREDTALFPDTMDQRYGAWAQLLVLFRMVHDGAHAGTMHLPQRHGVLFDPDRFKFLEGRREGAARQVGERIEAPLVPDGTIYRALEKLLVLDGERISYRALDVEQIGSIYQTMMGFLLETATGRSVAIKAQKTQGAPTTIDLEALLATPSAKRDAWFLERTGRKIGDKVKKAVAAANTIEDLHAALRSVIDHDATPDLVPQGALVLQPSEERRRSGSHYTPRALTKPIVETTLEPILARLRGEGEKPPRPEQILDLKVCDPAMGSAAFLVEACRQLGSALKESWSFYSETPPIPVDEDTDIFAMRLIAQRCIYGVDRNPVAVDLAKVSLWLVTLAKDHAFTFLDHALRHGDALVGLNRQQIMDFHWEVGKGFGSDTLDIPQHLKNVTALRQRIREANESMPDSERRDLWDQAQFELNKVRLYGDLVLAAFFSSDKARERETKLKEFADAVGSGTAVQYRDWLDGWRHEERPLAPFHWPIEFPEVFDRINPGFDSIIGNPPFLGGKRISTNAGEIYRDWISFLHSESSSNADLVAHFARRSFELIRNKGTFGLIATNSIAQGDTRFSGLRWICIHQGVIYAAQKRLKWPGQAAVIVSVVHVFKGDYNGLKQINNRDVNNITAFLFHRGAHENPVKLLSNHGKSFVGMFMRGIGFTFDDSKQGDSVTPLAKMESLIWEEPKNQEVIFPYIGGEEINQDPKQKHHRYTIFITERNEDLCRKNWPQVMKILDSQVKPYRISLGNSSIDKSHKEYWWLFANDRPELRNSISGLGRVLANSQVSGHIQFAFLPTNMIYAHTANVFPFESHSFFSVLQSRAHEIWARFFGSSMKDDLRYTPSDCFETFPFPKNWENDSTLEEAGKAYYEFRAAMMIRNSQGLTTTYNRFHDPDENDSDILKLRELHTEMDRAVLEAYGWSNISTDCEFLLDYEDDEDEPSNKRKKPWRYRWPDDVRDEVLARLLELNAQRAREEQLSGAVAAAKKSSKPVTKKKVDTETGQLF